MKKLLLTLLLTSSFSTFADSHLDFTLSDFCYLQPGVQDRGGVYYFPNEEVGISATSICVYKDAYTQYKSKGKLKNGVKDGTWTSWYKNGQKREESEYKEGKSHGRSTTWYKNGQKEFEINSRDDLYDGAMTSWYENGQKMEEVNFKDDKKDGKSTIWNENGQITAERTYKDGNLVSETHYTYHVNGQISSERSFKDSKQDGKSTEWHSAVHNKTQQYYNKLRKLLREDKLYKRILMLKEKQHVEISFKSEDLKKEAQKVIKENFPNLIIVEGSELEFEFTLKIPSSAYKKEEGYFIDGKKDGIWTWWDENGQITSEKYYKDGKETVVKTKYHENGQILALVYYKNNITVGKTKYSYYPNGQMKYEENLYRDMLNGKRTMWYENGQKRFEGNFKNDKRDGKNTWWYENGQIESEGNYINDWENGKWTQWYKNGQIKQEGNYKTPPFDFGRDGKWTYWYENGQIMSEKYYNDDKEDGISIVSTSWYENGNIFKVTNYNSKGNPVSQTQYYASVSGQKQWELNYKNKILDGKLTRWHENGQIKSVATYKDGKCISGDC